MAADPLILVSCGEASGDVYLSRVVDRIRARRPGARFAGIAGPRSRAEGVEAWMEMEDLAVMGFAEVLRHLPRLRRLARGFERRGAGAGADLFLAVDYPGLNVELARGLRRHRVPCLHFVPPKTWSWGAFRRARLRGSVDRCAVIFPFEVDHYAEAGIDARFVGHPLVDLHAAELSRAAPEREGLLLAPGSRRQEIERLAPVLVEAVSRLRSEGWIGTLSVSRAPAARPEWLAPLLRELGEVRSVEGELMHHLRSARAAIVCSGTATVEAALARTPHLIAYRTSTATYAVARALASVRHVGMANIVLDRRAFPEFVQGGCRARALAEATLGVWDDGAVRRAQLDACDELARRLGAPGAFDRVAAMALEMVEGGQRGSGSH